MVSKSEVAERTQICLELICFMLCTNLVLGKMKTSVMKHRAQVKLITAMEVVGVMYTEPEVDKHNGPGLGEDLTRAVRKLREIFS